MIPRAISCCRVCRNHHLETVVNLGTQKLTGIFPRSPNLPILEGPLELVRCMPDSQDCCGLLQLRHSYPQEAMYGENYGYRSGLNASMVRHLHKKTEALLALAKPKPQSLIVDIGCNDGTLLNSYPQDFRRVGIDPVARKFLSFYHKDIQVITEFFSTATWRSHLGSAKASIITSIAMFYDIENPLAFMKDIASCLADDGIWHFEQSYMPLMLQQLAYDTICHEHIEYYALSQIDWMTKRAGLKIIALETSSVNGGSLAVTAALANSPYPEASEDLARLSREENLAGYHTTTPFDEFRSRIFMHRDELISIIQQLTSSGKKLLGYGASTKGNVLLQFCGFSTKEIPFIAEVNSEKFGCFTPGTNIPIISEEDMHAMKPDCLLVLPWHFRQNIIGREQAYLSRKGRLLFPLPTIAFYPQ